MLIIAEASWYGKTGIYFVNEVDSSPKVNTEVYLQLLQEGLLVDCGRLVRNYTFMQDGASSHTSNPTPQFLKHNTPDFIKKNQWPPQSADLNPMDYFVWPLMMKNVYEKRRTPYTKEELRQKIVQSWDEIDLETIRKGVAAFRKRLLKVLKKKRGTY